MIKVESRYTRIVGTGASLNIIQVSLTQQDIQS